MRRRLRGPGCALRQFMETHPWPACSRLMEKDREGEPAEPAADWSDYAMAAVVAAVTLGIPLLVLLFR
jgi:hypothetical protein